MRSLRGIARSFSTYHGHTHLQAMVAFYHSFVKPGDLVFDIGAHVGDRTRAFLHLGCRVVAVEPQATLTRLLKLRYLLNSRVEVIPAALADGASTLNFWVNRRNPTISTASHEFICAAMAGPPGWQDEAWDYQTEVPASTLDELIGRYGCPAFTKIDVEGFEDRVLAGLSEPLPALSFEFTTLQRHVALRALARVQLLGAYEFNACLGERWERVFTAPQAGEDVALWLKSLPFEANSGDIYCIRSGF